MGRGKMKLPIITAKMNARNKVKYTIITTIDEREDKAETGLKRSGYVTSEGNKGRSWLDSGQRFPKFCGISVESILVDGMCR